MTPQPPAIALPDPAVIVLVGPAGSGKTTFARRHVRAVDVLSSDTFRALVSGDAGDQRASGAAFALLRRTLDERARRRRSTVVDATNLTRRERGRFLGIARRYGLQCVAVVFDVPLELCLQRAAQRADRVVPAEVVARQHAIFERHRDGIADEGFDEVVTLTPNLDGTDLEVTRVAPDPDDTPPGGEVRGIPAADGPEDPLAADGGRAPAAIIDLDGTLTSAAWRVPLVKGARRDWPAFFAGMDRDAPVRPLIELVGWMADHVSILLVTGRPDDHEPAIRGWLADHDVPYEQLWMRPGGDRRPDTIVKRDIFRHAIAPHYDVRLVIDDRPRVVEMWRDEGLYVLAALDPKLDPLDRVGPAEGTGDDGDGDGQSRRRAASGTS